MLREANTQRGGPTHHFISKTSVIYAIIATRIGVAIAQSGVDACSDEE
jgi:hypothetical protein